MRVLAHWSGIIWLRVLIESFQKVKHGQQVALVVADPSWEGGKLLLLSWIS